MANPATFLRKNGGPFIAIILFAAGLFALNRLLGEVHSQDILQRIRTVPGRSLVLAVVSTVLGFGALAGYDWSALRYIGRKLPLPTIGLVSFIGFALSNSLGVGAVTGAAVRYRLYTRLGLEPGEIAIVSTFCAAGFGLGVTLVGGLTLVLQPTAFAGVPPDVARWGAILVLAGLAGLLFAGSRKGVTLRLGRYSFALPTSRVLLGQVVFSVLDLGLAGATLFVLLPAGGPSFLEFLPIFALAAIAGVISHVPGGIGVFESVILAAMPAGLAPEGVAAALLLYRAIYYLAPFLIAFVLLTAGELLSAFKAWAPVARAGELAASTLEGTARVALPAAAAGIVFISGLLLLLKPALPLSAEAANELETVFPLAFVEVSNLLGSVVGMILIVLSHGLLRRIRSAMWLTVALSVTGAVFSLGQGLDLDRPFLLLGAGTLLVAGRQSFHRRAQLISKATVSGWTLASAAALMAVVWLVIFSHKAVPYGNELWWEFAFDKQAPRAMRAAVGAAATVLILYTVAALRLAWPRRTLPDTETLAKVAAIVHSQDDADANLALVGDKMMLFSDTERSFVMYGIRRSSFIALGDPVGLPEEAPELVWSFKEQAIEHGGRAAFYQVGASHLDWYADAGFSLHKLGEEAHVPLPEFDLRGPRRRKLRQSRHRAERDGLSFAIVEPPLDDALLADLKRISDAWLKDRATREKGFSLGRFEPDYLRRFPIALVEQSGELSAFANVFVTASKAEATIDLMRHLPDKSPTTMDFLFTELMLALKAQGFADFNLGMAPLAGLSGHPYAPTWDRLGAFLFRYGGHFYNFAGLRAFKDKFDPNWQARYLATAGGLDPFVVSLDVAALVNRGLAGAVKK